MSIKALLQQHGHDTILKRRVSAEDEAGVNIDVWIADPMPIKAWPQPAMSSVIERYAARTITVTHSCYVAANLGAKQGDVLVARGKTYAVRGVEDQAGVGRLWCLRLEEQLG